MSGNDIFAEQVNCPFFRAVPDLPEKPTNQHDAAAQAEYKSKRTAALNEKNHYLKELAKTFHKDLLSELGLVPTMPESAKESAEALPRGAWMAQITFTLQRNLFSRNDFSIYPTDNPMCREWVTKVPMLTGSTWKGNLRAAAYEIFLRKAETLYAQNDPELAKKLAEYRLRLWHIFGDEKGRDQDFNPDKLKNEIEHGNVQAFLNESVEVLKPVKEEFRGLKKNTLVDTGDHDYHSRGRVHCLPTYFDQLDCLGVDVFNPRDRITLAGTVPIYYEVVPAGTPVTMTLLYMPFDLLASSDEDLSKERVSDWNVICGAIVHLFQSFGVGGKKSSGFGTAKNKIEVSSTQNRKMEKLKIPGLAQWTPFTK